MSLTTEISFASEAVAVTGAVSVIGLCLGLLVIITRWVTRERRHSRKNGYHVVRLSRGQYVYEEARPDQRLQLLPIWHDLGSSIGILSPGTLCTNNQLAFNCTVKGIRHVLRLPTESQWDQIVPAWAIGRRPEIHQRIYEAFSKNFGEENVVEE